jgi:hypothetical protein
MDERELLRQTADYAADFLATLDERPVNAQAGVDELTERLGPAATSASSPAVRCPRRSPPTGSRRRGTRTGASG